MIVNSSTRAVGGAIKLIECAWMLLACQTLNADALWFKGKSEPHFGTVVRQDDQEISFRPWDQAIPIDFDRSTIETLIVNIDSKRLESLSPQNWSAYRDYAEELAIQKRDPTARDLAIRLYLIAANGGSGDLRQSALAGLVALAENDQQRQKWETLKRLTGSTEWFDRNSMVEAKETIDTADTQLALQVVRLIRKGQGAEASVLLDQPDIESKLRHWKEICSVRELKTMAPLNRLTNTQLHQLLQIELLILAREFPQHEIATKDRVDWGVYAQANASESAELPNFKNVTLFDPEQSLFRSGRWVKP